MPILGSDIGCVSSDFKKLAEPPDRSLEGYLKEAWRAIKKKPGGLLAYAYQVYEENTETIYLQPRIAIMQGWRTMEKGPNAKKGEKKNKH